jgi:predicted nucleic acid-binding Zn ribbon protein
MIALRCRVCGAPIPEALAHIMRYCSTACRKVARKVRTFGPVACEWCGAALPSAARKDGRRFCGRKCWSEWRKWDTDALYLKRDKHQDAPVLVVVAPPPREVVVLPGGIVAERVWCGAMKTSLPGIGAYAQRPTLPETDDDDD